MLKNIKNRRSNLKREVLLVDLQLFFYLQYNDDNL